MFLLTVSFMFSYGFELPSSVFHFSSPDSIISHRAGLLMTNCLLFVTGDVFISVWFWRKAQGFDRSLFSCYVVSDSFVTPWTISLPGSSARGIFQARILEWVAISFSRGSSWPSAQSCLLHWQADSLPPSHQRNLVFDLFSCKAYYSMKEAQWVATLSLCLSGLRFILPLPLISCVTLDKYVISLCLKFPHI